MFYLPVIALFVSLGSVAGQTIPISDLHQNNSSGVPLLLNSIVQVQGVVTVSDQFANVSYLQDSTGGVAVFDAGFVGSVQIGDTVLITGTVAQFRGLTELVTVTIDSMLGNGGQPEPKVITASDVNAEGIEGVENLEGQLVRLNDVTLNNPSGNWPSSNGTEVASDSTGSFTIFIDRDTEIASTAKPQAAFDIIGVFGQFDFSSPFTSGYQIIPRFLPDIIEGEGIIFSSAPKISDVGRTWVEIAWSTEDSSFGSMSFENESGSLTGEVESGLTAGEHSVRIEGLDPATFYFARAIASFGTDTVRTAEIIIITVSPSESSGEIGVYFNNSVDTSYAISGNYANGDVNFLNLFVEKIESAEYSIDFCLYSMNISGISTAIIDARDRGVKIRFIYQNRSTQSAVQTLISAGIEVIDNTFGDNPGTEFQHNKFVIFDGRGDASASNDWLLTGSTNWTNQGTFDNKQNLILIQDRSLAKVYTREFNEMWGSVSDIPNPDSSKFTTNKANNIPHFLRVGGIRVGVYMSPTDGVTSKIIEKSGAALESIYFAILAFTRDDIAGGMKERFDNVPDFHLRGLFDDSMDQNVSVYPDMIDWGMDVYLDSDNFTLHHKYMIIDGFNAGEESVLITGSHNWSTSAETRHNENTIIIYDSLIVNQYVQEFAARYKTASGLDLPKYEVISVKENDGALPEKFSLSQNYPNPFNPVTAIEFTLPTSGVVSLIVYNLLGQEVARLVDDFQPAGYHKITWDASNMASGIYLYRIEVMERRSASPTFVQTRKMVLLK